MARKKINRKKRKIFLRKAIVPFVFEHPSKSLLDLLEKFEIDTVVVGVVPIEDVQALSAGANQAAQLRQQLQSLVFSERVTVRAQVLVSQEPWIDLVKVAVEENASIIILDWECHLSALGVDAATVLNDPPVHVAMLRGPVSTEIQKVLVPVRGGPHAELALRFGLSLRPQSTTSLHLYPADQKGPRADTPYRGLELVLPQLTGVQPKVEATDDPAQSIIDAADSHDLVIMGISAAVNRPGSQIGDVAEKVINEVKKPVIIVQNRRRMRLVTGRPDQTAGAEAISILVDKWFAENTFSADEFSDLQALYALKKEQGVTISLALPALNEEETVGKVIETVKNALMLQVPLLDEIVLIDSNSTDRTRDIAKEFDIPVYIHQELLPELGARPGKGEALWKSLMVTRGDIVAWIDTDIRNIDPRFVYGIIGPLLLDSKIKFVKAFYQRPIKVDGKFEATGGGRVTELTARPLLNLFYPELSGLIQPLAGEYAGRREVLEKIPFFSGYGVEIGMLIDVLEKCNLSGIAQVDLLERIHHNQPLQSLSKMSFAILQAVVRKLERRYDKNFLEDVNKTMKLIQSDQNGFYLQVQEIMERDRPPMCEIKAYQERNSA